MSVAHKIETTTPAAKLQPAPLPRDVAANDAMSAMMILGFPVNFVVAVLFVQGLMAYGHGNSLAFWAGGFTVLMTYLAVAGVYLFLSMPAGLDVETVAERR